MTAWDEVRSLTPEDWKVLRVMLATTAFVLGCALFGFCSDLAIQRRPDTEVAGRVPAEVAASAVSEESNVTNLLRIEP